MNRTRIEWCDYTWNPIKGLCPVGCWYCYARKIYQRFGENICANYRDGYICLSRLEDEKFPSKPACIFVCSTFELFHRSVDKWRDAIFDVIKSHPQHTFFILTKLPQKIDRPMPENVWLGISCDGENWKADDERIDYLLYSVARGAPHRFISYEPALGSPRYWGRKIGRDFRADWIDWIIIGALTGNRSRLKHERPYPEMLRGYVDSLLKLTRRDGIPLFMKNNLASIWQGKLIQEWPEIRP